ncbi:hypothetical protein ACFLZH_01385 [Patescibacteria group bacterium]
MVNSLRWGARILTIIFILFISMFSIDVFFEGYLFPEVLIALFMHMIPSFLLIAALIIAWKYPKIGGIIFILFALFTIFFFKTCKEVITFLIITLPPALIGLLFLYESIRSDTIRNKKTSGKK